MPPKTVCLLHPPIVGRTSQKMNLFGLADSESCFLELSAQAKRLPWGKKMQPVWERGKEGSEFVGNRKVYLECQSCLELLNINNPQVVLNRHKSKCTGEEDDQLDAENSTGIGSDAKTSSGASTGSRPRGIQIQTRITDKLRGVDANTQRKILIDLAYFWFTSDTPFRRWNNMYFKRALLRAGVKTPDEKYLRTVLLNEVYTIVQEQVLSKVKALIMVST